jgi:hypothetical protein
VLGLDAASFNFNGFYPDGAINTDAQQPVFVLNWNAPADYNLSSGLMNVNASATKGNNNNLQKAQPAQTAAYQAMTIKSYFNKGKFEQELEGTLIKNLNQTQIENADQARGGVGAPGGPGVRNAAITPSGSSAIFDESGKVSSIRRNEETGELYDGGGLYDTALPPPSASAPAAPPTSNGPILFQGSDDDGAPESNVDAGQTMAPRDD